MFETFFPDFTSKDWHGSELASYLMDTTKSISAISPFACLSGVVDNDLFHGEIIDKVSYIFIVGKVLLQFKQIFNYSPIKFIFITIFLPLCNMMALCSSVTLQEKQFERPQNKNQH